MFKVKPSKNQLVNLSREEIAENFKVSDKTVVRWLKHYEMFEKKGRKLDQAKAEKIRKKHQEGYSIKKLASEYQVTFSSISRVLNDITYKSGKKTYADISVVYNPN